MTYQEIIDALWERVLEELNGIIAGFSGAIIDIPTGWQLCDGTNGTIDLRDKFIVGAGTAYDPGDTGGALTHTHDITITPHSHVIPGGTDLKEGTGYENETNAVPLAGTTDPGSSLPPYYALAFIQKV